MAVQWRTVFWNFMSFPVFSSYQALCYSVSWLLTPFDFIICYRFGRSRPYIVTSRLILWGTWGLIPGLVWESSGNLPGLENALVFLRWTETTLVIRNLPQEIENQDQAGITTVGRWANSIHLEHLGTESSDSLNPWDEVDETAQTTYKRCRKNLQCWVGHSMACRAWVWCQNSAKVCCSHGLWDINTVNSKSASGNESEN